MIKVLDLFAGTQSVRKALEMLDLDFDYIGIDIYSPEKANYILDLTQDDIVNKLEGVLPKDWKPDFIWASPICNKFSKATTGPNGNTYFIVENNELVVRKDFSDVKHNGYCNKVDKWGSYVEQAELALKMFENTKSIINHYNVPFAIENPAQALSKYILKEYVKNDTNYCMYGFDYKKPTSIYSNRGINLMKCNHKKHISNIQGNIGYEKPTHWNSASTYADRSSVPPKLIVDVFMQLFNLEFRCNDGLCYKEDVVCNCIRPSVYENHPRAEDGELKAYPASGDSSKLYHKREIPSTPSPKLTTIYEDLY